MECAPHRIWKKLMALVLSLVLMAVMLPGALAVDLNVDAGFYFKQSRGGTCTLASAAMMLRRRAFLDGLTDWTDVTENSVRGSAWAGGLSHSFNYNAMQVATPRCRPTTERRRRCSSSCWQSTPRHRPLRPPPAPRRSPDGLHRRRVLLLRPRRQRLLGPVPISQPASPSQVLPATGTYLPTITAPSRRWTASVWKECATRSISAPARA